MIKHYHRMGCRVYFISGPDNITYDEFITNYTRRIRKSNAIYPDCTYLVGDADGTDEFAQKYLLQCGISPERITIYYREVPPVNPARCKTLMMRVDLERITRMTTMSSHDITWTRPGEMNTDADRQIERRRQIIINSKKPKKEKSPFMSIYVPKTKLR